ncbi:hypothetical protein AAZX31_02G167800 [Glycine max]
MIASLGKALRYKSKSCRRYPYQLIPLLVEFHPLIIIIIHPSYSLSENRLESRNLFLNSRQLILKLNLCTSSGLQFQVSMPFFLNKGKLSSDVRLTSLQFV